GATLHCARIAATWMSREFPSLAFERYCDDAVVHCRSESQARYVRDAVAARLGQVGLELHPDKTRIVYCKDADRGGAAEYTKFRFLQVERAIAESPAAAGISLKIKRSRTRPSTSRGAR